MSSSKEQDLLFEELVYRHTDIAFHMARSWCGDAAAAEDLAQQAFIKAYRAFDRFERGTNFKAWLLKILRRCFLDWTRSQKRQRPTVSIDQVDPAQAPPSPEAPRAIDIENKAVFYDLFGEELSRLLKELPMDYQIAVLLCDVEGLSYQEIADILECPVGTVRSRIHRGRGLLHDLLRDYAQKVGFLRRANS